MRRQCESAIPVGLFEHDNDIFNCFEAMPISRLAESQLIAA